jgi:hypothetical protein
MSLDISEETPSNAGSCSLWSKKELLFNNLVERVEATRQRRSVKRDTATQDIIVKRFDRCSLAPWRKIFNRRKPIKTFHVSIKHTFIKTIDSLIYI